jgi:biotin operon repressor
MRRAPSPHVIRRRTILAAMGAKPVTGASLARLAGCSLSTIYRDIEHLRAEGHRIGGATNYGYALLPSRPPRYEARA